MQKPDYEVAIVGAGFAGIGTAIRLQKANKNSFIIFERGSEVGGTWRDNIYPGCGCDVPSHLYSFSFEPNPNWTRRYSKQPEILAYLKHCVEKYNLQQNLHLNSEIREAVFDEKYGFYTISDQNGHKFTAKVLVCGLGPFNYPNIPALDGLGNFKGKIFHSSQWDNNFDLSGKRVAVIGTGASAIQLVPEIADKVAKLYVFQRTAPWLIPKPDGEFSGFTKKLFNNAPLLQKVYREFIYWTNEFIGQAFMGNEVINKLATIKAKNHIMNQIKDPKLLEAVTPNFKIGCKRILPSDAYYPALQKPNVQLVTEGIEKIITDGIVGKDGTKFEADVIIFGTGFHASEFPKKFTENTKIVGLGSRNLFEEWAENGIEAYKGTTISGFPNMFFMLGPNSGGGHNSVVHIMESQMNYLINYLELLNKQGENAYFDVKSTTQKVYNEDIQERMKKTVWASGCQSWYINSKGKNTNIYPRLNKDFRKETLKVNLDDYLVGNK